MLTARQQSAPRLEIYPENEQVWALWRAVAGQWRVVSAGMTGLVWMGIDYLQLEFVMRMHRIPPDEQPAAFDLIQLMEREAVPLLNDRK